MLYAYINTLVNGQVVETRYKMATDFDLTEQTANQTQTNIKLLVEDGQPFPRANDIIEVRDDEDDTVYFYGVAAIPKSPKYTHLHDPKLYTIACRNGNGILARRVVNLAMQKKYIHEVVQYIFDNYIAQEGFSLGTISTTAVKLDKYTASDMRLDLALDELAGYVGGTWTVTNDKKFNFIAQGDFLPFAHTINRDFVIGADIQRVEKDIDMRTVQIVKGMQEKTSAQTESFTYDGETNVFPTNYPVAEMPQIMVGQKVVSGDSIGTVGLDTNKAFVFTYNASGIQYNPMTIYFTDGTTGTLASGDTVTVVYVGLYRIRVTRRNQAMVTEIALKTGTSGMIEAVELNNTVTTRSDAAKYADGFLTQFSQSQNEVTFWDYERHLADMGVSLSDLQLHTKLTINLPEIDIVGDYVITERKIRPVLRKVGGENIYEGLRIDFKLKDRAFMKSYADVMNDYQKDKATLTIRGDDVVLDATEIDDSVAFDENTALGLNYFNPIYPTCNTQYAANNELASPVALPDSMYAWEV